MAPSPPGRASHNSGADKATTRKRGKRGEGRRLRRQIEAKVRERQEAWREGGQKNVTERLTVDLNGSQTRDYESRSKGLYAELRATGLESTFEGEFAGRSSSVVVTPGSPTNRAPRETGDAGELREYADPSLCKTNGAAIDGAAEGGAQSA